MRRFLKMALLTALILLPTTAFAQSSSILVYNQAFIPGGNWLVPTTVLTARSTKLTLQWDF